MRARSLIIAAALAGLSGPASAQFFGSIGGDPYGQIAPGVIGSGAANTTLGQPRCSTTAGGRGGPPRYDCSPSPTPSPRAQ